MLALGGSLGGAGFLKKKARDPNLSLEQRQKVQAARKLQERAVRLREKARG